MRPILETFFADFFKISNARVIRKRLPTHRILHLLQWIFPGS
ncbi:hypothetical protein LEP1GSC060_2282 [Leptospira weilii serovar Ranarum str. ICFT]|uniref:Uncharacterized protein n=1 Tax=Leptospira weilii serovar Ranarum str. ICFT TaxID=1218598 RepID=N1WFV9_9LEPT|nr:hypothetical protein LEP1GSC060_2282 [Leptospira weilii serovar Ranarum str. ICFT]